MPYWDIFEKWLSKARSSSYRRQAAEHAVAVPGETPFLPSGLRHRILFIGGD
jgi:hypothetical protein